MASGTNETTGTSNAQEVEKNEEKKGKGNGKKSSPVWDFFDRVFVGVGPDGVDIYKAICKFCHKALDGRSSSGTSHLTRHHKKCGDVRLKEQENKIMKQQVLQSKCNKGKFDLSSFKFDQEASRNDLAMMIIVHEYPLSIVEHEWFRKFVNGLNPLFKLVSRNTVKRGCFKIFDVEKAVVMEMLDRLDSRIGLTTDMWTSSTQKKGFMAVTAHFIVVNWKLQSRIISFIFVPSPHTAEALSEALMKILLDWNID